MAAELRELRGIPAAIQKTFDNQRSKAKGSEPAPESLLALSQWKALQETNKKERSLPATPVKKPGKFTAASEKVRLTPRQILAPSPKRASTATSVSSGRAGVLAAIDSKIAFFVPKCTQHPSRQAIGGPGPVGLLVKPMRGLGGLGCDPEAALVARRWKTALPTQTKPPGLIVCQEARTSGTPGTSGMSNRPIRGPRALGFDPKATRKNPPRNGEKPCFALPSAGAEKSKITISDTKGVRRDHN